MLWAVGALFAPDAPETTTEANASAPMAAAAADDPPPARLAVAPGVRTYGSVEVVDLDDARSLRAQLVEIVRRSHGRTVVLQTYMKKSATCDAVAAALPDKRMQLALANVTLVLVDVDDFDEELHEMSIETATAPWFYKLDAEADPSDAISADAWGAKAPDQMAAALARFMRRRPARR